MAEQIQPEQIADDLARPVMSRQFAKLFETPVGQIVAMRRASDKGPPEIRFFFDPDVDGLTICQIGIQFNDDDTGEEKADKAFALIDEEGAIKVVTTQIEAINEITTGGQS